MTVGELIKKLKGLDGNLPVYISDHDHSEWETNGKLNSVYKVNQKDMDKWNKKHLDPIFKIEGEYLVLRVG